MVQDGSVSQRRPVLWTNYSLRPLTLYGCREQPLNVLLKTVAFHVSVCMVHDLVYAQALCGGYEVLLCGYIGGFRLDDCAWKDVCHLVV